MSLKSGSLATATAEGDYKKASELKKELEYEIDEGFLDDPYVKAISAFSPAALISKKYNQASIYYQYDVESLSTVVVDLQNRFPTGVSPDLYANFMAYAFALMEVQKK